MKILEVDKKDVMGSINRLKATIKFLESLLEEEDGK
jgi:hypothetical protein